MMPCERDAQSKLGMETGAALVRILDHFMETRYPTAHAPSPRSFLFLPLCCCTSRQDAFVDRHPRRRAGWSQRCGHFHECRQSSPKGSARASQGIIVTTEEASTLTGTVHKAERKARAAELARQVKWAVRRVKNDLDIRADFAHRCLSGRQKSSSSSGHLLLPPSRRLLRQGNRIHQNIEGQLSRSLTPVISDSAGRYRNCGLFADPFNSNTAVSNPAGDLLTGGGRTEEHASKIAE